MDNTGLVEVRMKKTLQTPKVTQKMIDAGATILLNSSLFDDPEMPTWVPQEQCQLEMILEPLFSAMLSARDED